MRNYLKLGLAKLKAMKKTVAQFFPKVAPLEICVVPLEVYVDPCEVYPASAAYLKKYWLHEEEYVSHWKPLQDKIFDAKVYCLPDRIFLPEFKLMCFLGGLTFVEKDFLLLQACMRELGEKYFVIIENYAQTCVIPKGKDAIPVPWLKFKYPIEVTWREIYTGGFLSEVIMGFWGEKEFYVFGESGLWGKYAANEYGAIDISSLSLDILGFKEECAGLFREKFHTYMDKYEKKETMYSLSSPSLHPAYKEYKEHLY